MKHRNVLSVNEQFIPVRFPFISDLNSSGWMGPFNLVRTLGLFQLEPIQIKGTKNNELRCLCQLPQAVNFTPILPVSSNGHLSHGWIIYVSSMVPYFYHFQ